MGGNSCTVYLHDKSAAHQDLLGSFGALSHPTKPQIYQATKNRGAQNMIWLHFNIGGQRVANW